MSPVTDTREKMANQLLMRGWATMRELLEMSFGEWPVKGLEIDAGMAHEKKVSLIPCDEDNCIASVQPLDGRRAIKHAVDLAKAVREQDDSVHAVLGHELVHVLQHEGVYWKTESPFWQKVIDSPPSLIFQFLFKRTRAEKIAKRFHKETKTLKSAFNEETRKRLGYLSDGDELQARLHEVMMAGYPHWGRLPQTKHELTLAIMATGLLGMQARFTTDSGAALPSVFLKEVDVEAAREVGTVPLNLCHDQEGQARFIDTLTALYANLLELYGDKNARARFGLDAHYKPLPATKSAASVTPSPA